MFVVVRMICGAFGILTAGVLVGVGIRNSAGRAPLGLVVPSRFMIFSAAALRAAATPAPIPRSAFDARRPELSVGRDEIFSRIVGFLPAIYLPFLVGLAVLALSLKSFAVGAPLAPALRIFSPEPAAMRAFLAWMFAYRPGFMGISTFSN